MILSECFFIWTEAIISLHLCFQCLCYGTFIYIQTSERGDKVKCFSVVSLVYKATWKQTVGGLRAILLFFQKRINKVNIYCLVCSPLNHRLTVNWMCGICSTKHYFVLYLSTVLYIYLKKDWTELIHLKAYQKYPSFACFQTACYWQAVGTVITLLLILPRQ